MKCSTIKKHESEKLCFFGLIIVIAAPFTQDKFFSVANPASPEFEERFRFDAEPHAKHAHTHAPE